MKITLKLSLLWKELSMFGLAQFLGIWSAYKFLPYMRETFNEASFKFTLIDLIFLVAFGVLFFFLLAKTPRGAGIFIRIFLFFAIFSGSQIVFATFFNENLAALFALLLAVLFYVVRLVFIQNIAMIFALAGIGSFFGLSVTPTVAVIILLALSFYDIIAVYWTKHMVKLAEGMIRTRVIFGLVIPEKTSGFKTSMVSAQPGKGFMILGSGDVVMPIILSASLVSYSLLAAITVGLFSMLGLILTHMLFIGQRIRRPMAALPPIAVMSIIGYLIALLII